MESALQYIRFTVPEGLQESLANRRSPQSQGVEWPLWQGRSHGTVGCTFDPGTEDSRVRIAGEWNRDHDTDSATSMEVPAGE